MPVKKKTVKKTVAKKTVKKPTVAKKAVVKSVVKPALKETGLKMSVYDLKGKVVESISLPKEIFGQEINKHLLSQAVRIYLANQRRGTVSTKTRGEVTKSTRKIWRQKGTGRARHGARSAPIFVGGGVVFGPKQRDFSLSFPQKMKRKALFSALSSKVKNGEIKVLSGLDKITPKTKIVADAIDKLGIEKKNRNLLLITTDSKIENVNKAARNVEGLKILSANMLNVYEVLDNNQILLMKTAVDAIKSTFLKEEKN